MNPTHPRLANGRYVVRRCIGTGGMGAVFLAYDDVLKGQRAIKVLKPELAAHPESRSRFRTEAIAMAQLTHPGIVRVFDQGQEALTAFLVMEYLPAGSLRALMRTSGTLDREEALCVCLDVAEALDHAHRKGVIHRDIKPDNILLGDEGAKLTDFGLARVANTDGGLTRSGATFGTPSFMPPEQRLDGKNTTTRSDLYALCATLFLLVTNENPIDLYERDARDRLLDGVDERIAAIVRTGCAADPLDRFEDAACLAEALEAARDTPGAPRRRPVAIPSETQGQTQDLDTLNRLWRSFTTPNATAVPQAEGDNETHAFFASDPPPSQLPFQPGPGVTQENSPVPQPPPADPPRPGPGRWAALGAVLLLGVAAGGLLLRPAPPPSPASETLQAPSEAAKGAPTEDPGAGAWQDLLAAALFAADQAARAVPADATGDPRVLALRGVLAGLEGQPDALQAAVRHAAAAPNADPTLAKALSLADLSAVTADGDPNPTGVADRLLAWDTLLASARDPRADVLFLVSLHPHLSARQLAEALQAARSRHPDTAIFAWLQLVLKREQRSLADQEALLTDALAAFPTVSALQTERGRLLLRRGEMAVAREVLTQASNLHPADPEPHTLLAELAIRVGDPYAFNQQLLRVTGDTVPEALQLDFLWRTGEAYASVGQPAAARKVWHAEFHYTPDAEALHRMRADVRGSRAATLLDTGGETALTAARTAVAAQGLRPETAAPLQAALAYDAGVQAVRRNAPKVAGEHLETLRALAEGAPPTSAGRELVALLELELLLGHSMANSRAFADALEERAGVLTGRCSGLWMAARVAARTKDLESLSNAQEGLARAACQGPELEARLYEAEATALLAEAATAARDQERSTAAQEAFASLWPTPEAGPLVRRMARLAEP